MSDTIITYIVAYGAVGIIACEAVVRFIGKFKYGVWAALLPPAMWFEIVKKHFFLLLIVFFAAAFGAFYLGIGRT